MVPEHAHDGGDACPPQVPCQVPAQGHSSLEQGLAKSLRQVHASRACGASWRHARVLASAYDVVALALLRSPA